MLHFYTLLSPHPFSSVFGWPCGALEFTFAEVQPGPEAIRGPLPDSPSCGLYLFLKSVGQREIESESGSWENSGFLRSLLGSQNIPECQHGWRSKVGQCLSDTLWSRRVFLAQRLVAPVKYWIIWQTSYGMGYDISEFESENYNTAI